VPSNTLADYGGHRVPQGGQCYGAIEVIGKQTQAIKIYGDDPTTSEKDGFMENEPLRFKLWKKETDEEFLLDVTFDQNMPNPDPVFNDHGLSAITDMTISSNEVNNVGENVVSIFPNPTKGKVYIRLSQTDFVTISIFDITGQLILSESFTGTKSVIDLSSFETGIYFIKLKGKNTLKTARLIKR